MSDVVVVDTGPLIHLAQANAVSLLELTGKLLVPETVFDEFERGRTDLGSLRYELEPVDVADESTYPRLDAGETAALVRSQRHDAMLLSDDLDARKTAEHEGIEVHGSIGVVLYAYSRGEFTDVAAKRLLRRLERDTNLYLSTPLIEYAIERVESDDAGW